MACSGCTLSLIHEFSSKSNAYVLNIAQNGQFLASYYSDGTVEIYNVNTMTLLHSHLFAQVPIGISFQKSGSLWIGLKTGRVELYDVLNAGFGNCVQEIDVGVSSCTCITLNSCETLHAIGAEENDTVKSSEAFEFPFISLFDIRNTSSKLFSYTDSHSGGVSSLTFDPQNPNLLISGGLDGIVNVFDVLEHDEDDALLQSFNAESSVKSVGVTNSTDFIYCTTDDSRIGVWNRASGDELLPPIRNQVSTAEFPHLVNCFTDLDSIFALLTNDRGEINIGRLKIDETTKFANKFLFNDISSFISNHTDAVRCVGYERETQQFVTGGEDGKIVIGRMKFEEELSFKAAKPKKMNKKRINPY